MSVLFSDGMVIAYEIIAGVGLAANSLRLFKKNKKLKEMISLQKDRIREEELDAMLRNQVHMERNAQAAVKNNPYEVSYHEEKTAAYEKEQAYVSVQVEELGTLSNKKYVVHVFERVKIGRDDSNKIILNDVTIAAHQIELLRVEQSIFAKNLAPGVKVTLKRKRKKFSLGESPVCLNSGDELYFGNTTLRFCFL